MFHLNNGKQVYRDSTSATDLLVGLSAYPPPDGGRIVRRATYDKDTEELLDDWYAYSNVKSTASTSPAEGSNKQ